MGLEPAIAETKHYVHCKGKCLQEGVVHKAMVIETESMKQDIYIGMTENPFKTRYNLHNSSFRLPHKRSTTILSEHLWTLKDAGVIYKTEWTILDKAKLCSPAEIICDLCLAGKYYILLEKSRLLSKRSEIFGTCPTEENTFYKIRIAATKKIRPDEYFSTKQICRQENLKMGN